MACNDYVVLWPHYSDSNLGYFLRVAATETPTRLLTVVERNIDRRAWLSVRYRCWLIPSRSRRDYESVSFPDAMVVLLLLRTICRWHVPLTGPYGTRLVTRKIRLRPASRGCWTTSRPIRTRSQ